MRPITIKEQLAALRRRLLRRWGGSAEEVDELVQEAFLRLYRYEREQAMPIRDPLGFLIDVAERARVDRLRHTAVVERLLPRLNEWSAGADEPEQVLAAQELLERLERRFARAHPHARQVFLLHRFDGLSYGQIAQALSISTATVKRRLAEALLIYDSELAR